VAGCVRYNPDHVDSMGELLQYFSAKNNTTKADHYIEEMTKRGVKFFSPNSAWPPKGR